MTAAPEVVEAARLMMMAGWWLVAVDAHKKPFGDLFRGGADWRQPRPWADIETRLALPQIVAVGFLGGDLNDNVVPIDFDKPAGEFWWMEQCRKIDIDPDAFPTVITPGKVKANPDGTTSRLAGRHRYVHDTRACLGNSEGLLHMLGINIRGKGHCVLPPSPHPDGGLYRWARTLGSPGSVPPCPPFVYEAIERGRTAINEAPRKLATIARQSAGIRLGRHSTGLSRAVAYTSAALAQTTTKLAAMAPGGRNNALNTAALALGALVHHGGYTMAQAKDALMRACHANRLIEDDGMRSVEATFASGWAAGLASPRDLPPPREAPPMQNAFKNGAFRSGGYTAGSGHTGSGYRGPR